MDDIIDWLVTYVFMPFAVFTVIVGILFLIVVLPIAIYVESGKPTLTLRKDEWTCTIQHVERHWEGKFYVTEPVCDQFNRSKDR